LEAIRIISGYNCIHIEKQYFQLASPDTSKMYYLADTARAFQAHTAATGNARLANMDRRADGPSSVDVNPEVIQHQTLVSAR